MKLSVTDRSADRIKADVVVVFGTEKSPLGKASQLLEPGIVSVLKRLKTAGEITGKRGDMSSVATSSKTCRHCMVVGLGAESDLTLDVVRRAMGAVIRRCRGHHAQSVYVVAQLSGRKVKLGAELGRVLAEGAVMGAYTFQDYKSDPTTDHELSELMFGVPAKSDIAELDAGVSIGSAIGEGVCIARDLANTPGNDMQPEHFVQRAKDLLAKGPCKIELIDRKKAAKLGMNAFLGVAQGSESESYILVVRYTGTGKSAPIGLVGKGVTFDTGGISIKPSRGMKDMKADMSGAAAVLGSMWTISQLKPNVNVLAVMPLTENMPSSKAQRPGDVVTAMNGKTIEIVNTDAEGRLILADSLCYAVTEKVSSIVDIATLTGAAVVALGNAAIGVMGNDQRMIDDMMTGSEHNGERLWQLPLFDEYADMLKSPVADLMNAVEGGGAGTCTAGKFLEQFVGDTPWVHLDMAPKMMSKKTSGYDVRGASGAGVRTLVDYVLSA